MLQMLYANNIGVNMAVIPTEQNFLDNDEMSLQERINELFAENPKKRPAHLAKALNCSRSCVSNWINGKVQEISIDNAFGVGRFFGVSPEWVATGKGRKKIPEKSFTNVELGPEIKGKVPLISWVMAGEFLEVFDNFHPGDAEDWISTTVQIKEHTFALRVKGDSMESSTGGDSFPDGMIIIVEPGLDPLPGDYVIAKNGDEATFKKLSKDGPDWYLVPLNDRYPIKPLGDSKIIGIVIEAVRRFRR